MSPLLSALAIAAAPWALLAAELALITVMGRAINQLFLGAFGQRLYLLVMWPGVAVHELSHAAACVMTRTRVREVRLFSPQPGGRGEMVLGYVSHDLPRQRWKRVVIGAAPFFGGGAVMAALAMFALPESFRAAGPGLFATPDALALLALLWESFRAAVLEAARPAIWGDGLTWLVAWLLLAVGAHVSPSRSDLADAAAALAVLAAVILPSAVLFAWLWKEGFAAAGAAAGFAVFALAGAVGLAAAYIAVVLLGLAALAAPVYVFRAASGRHR